MRIPVRATLDQVEIYGRRYAVPPRLLELIKIPLIRWGDGFYVDEIPQWAFEAPPEHIIRKIIKVMAGILALPYQLEICEEPGPSRPRLYVYRLRGRRPSKPVPGSRIIGQPGGYDHRRTPSRYGWESLREGQTRIYTGTTAPALLSSFRSWCETRSYTSRSITTSRLPDGRVEVYRDR